MYLISGAGSGKLGISLRILIRAEFGHDGFLIGDDEIYNVIVTAHVALSIPFWAIPENIRIYEGASALKKGDVTFRHVNTVWEDHVARIVRPEDHDLKLV